MPPSRPIPRRRFITDEPTLSIQRTRAAYCRPRCARQHNHPRKQPLARIKTKGTREVPISSHIYYFVEFPRCERRHMAFLLQSPTFLIVAAAIAGLIALRAPGEHVQAQTNDPPAVAPTPRLTLTAEQEYIIREIILKDSNVQTQNSAPETVGDVVPEELNSIHFRRMSYKKCRWRDPTCSSSKMMR